MTIQINTNEIDQYTVLACAVTGEWLEEPTFVGKVVQSEWRAKVDTTLAHYDTYEHHDHEKVSCETETRAIELVWK